MTEEVNGMENWAGSIGSLDVTAWLDVESTSISYKLINCDVTAWLDVEPTSISYKLINCDVTAWLDVEPKNIIHMN